MLYGSVLVLVMLPAWRISFWDIVRRTLPSKKLLFVGSRSPSIRRVVASLAAKPDIGLVAIGYLDQESNVAELPYLGTLGDLESVVRQYKPDRVVVDDVEHAQPITVEQLLMLRKARIDVLSLRDVYEMVLGRVAIHDLKASHSIAATLGP